MHDARRVLGLITAHREAHERNSVGQACHDRPHPGVGHHERGAGKHLSVGNPGRDLEVARQRSVEPDRGAGADEGAYRQRAERGGHFRQDRFLRLVGGAEAHQHERPVAGGWRMIGDAKLDLRSGVADVGWQRPAAERGEVNASLVSTSTRSRWSNCSNTVCSGERPMAARAAFSCGSPLFHMREPITRMPRFRSRPGQPRGGPKPGPNGGTSSVGSE